MRLKASGWRAQETVQSLELSSAANHGSSYFPVVSFATARGDSIRFRDSTGTNPPSYRVGDAVTVLYVREASSKAIIDRGIWNWLPSIVVLLFGAALTSVSIRILRSSDSH
jgi:hypothetical protein